MVFAVVLSGFVVAILAPFLYRVLRGVAGWVFGAYAASLALYFASLVPDVASGSHILLSYSWVPTLGAGISLRVDGLSLLFSILISGVGAFVFVYGGGYLRGSGHLSSFYAWTSAFMASMLGLVLSDNLILMFVFWELTSLSSYMLIGIESSRQEARASALMALLVTAGGGLALLAGVVLIGKVAGTLEVSSIISSSGAFHGSSLITPALILILIGAFTKSAQFPFHFWLPRAMEAPTPVSAYLHSATMVKAGVYLLARLAPVFSGTELWQYVLPGIGGVTMVLGALLAVEKSDLKQALAYSTVSALGALVLVLGIPGEASSKAAVVFLVAHSLYKGSLFLAVGSVDHETGTRDASVLGGTWRAMPLTFVSAFLAALSMAGLPPTAGFLGKELLYEALLGGGEKAWVVLLFGVGANMLFVAVAGVVGVRVFLGKGEPLPREPHEAPPSMVLGALALSLFGILLAVVPQPALLGLISQAASSIYGRGVEVQLSLWHGLSMALFLSALTISGGVLLYLGRERLSRFISQVGGVLGRVGPERIYEKSMSFVLGFAGVQTRLLQSGYLRFYLIITLLVVFFLIGSAFLVGGGFTISIGGRVPLHECVIGAVVLASALISATSRGRLSAIAALGVVGYGVAILYMLYGAPDLAITQFAVETLTVILFVLVYFRLPRLSPLSMTSHRIRDALIAAGAGGVMAALLLIVASSPPLDNLKQFFGSASLEYANGRNIVNVILVDFRALDTMGETIVLAVSAVGIYGLLKLWVKK